jgi:hypothetical protein
MAAGECMGGQNAECDRAIAWEREEKTGEAVVGATLSFPAKHKVSCRVGETSAQSSP